MHHPVRSQQPEQGAKPTAQAQQAVYLGLISEDDMACKRSRLAPIGSQELLRGAGLAGGGRRRDELAELRARMLQLAQLHLHPHRDPLEAPERLRPRTRWCSMWLTDQTEARCCGRSVLCLSYVICLTIVIFLCYVLATSYVLRSSYV